MGAFLVKAVRYFGYQTNRMTEFKSWFPTAPWGAELSRGPKVLPTHQQARKCMWATLPHLSQGACSEGGLPRLTNLC